MSTTYYIEEGQPYLTVPINFSINSIHFWIRTYDVISAGYVWFGAISSNGTHPYTSNLKIKSIFRLS